MCLNHRLEVPSCAWFRKIYFKLEKLAIRATTPCTPQGSRRVDDGVKRVYAAANQSWDGNWRILTYSFPEEKRELRNEIRKELSWTGFGMIANSTWVSPNPLEEQVMAMIQTYHIADHAILFSSSALISHDNQTIIDKGWDLEHISQEYEIFIKKYRTKFAELREKALNNLLTDKECFIERTSIVHEYRKFLFKDPGFPRELLPSDWSGTRARELFWNYHQLVSIPAVRFFESLYESAPDKEITPIRSKAINPFQEVYV